jgi:outer membrane protease
MNNITVCAVLVIVCFAQYGFGQESVPDEPSQTGTETPRTDTRDYPHDYARDYALSMRPCFGFIYGQAEEIVYPGETKGPLLSQLLWDMKPVFYYGLQTDFSRVNPTEQHGFFSNLSLKFGIPGSSGIMEDRDWQSIENDALTSYSMHKNETRGMFLFDVSAGYAFPFLRVMILKAYVNVSYMNIRFSGFDGYGRYARVKTRNPNTDVPETYYPIDDNPKPGDYSGMKVINYTQEWLTAAPGVSFGYYFFKNFFTGLSFQISPLILCTALDDHLTNSKQFRDYIWGGLLIEPGAELSFDCNDRIGLSLELSWRYIGGTKGNSFLRTYGTGAYSQAGMSGAGSSVFDTGLFLRVRL